MLKQGQLLDLEQMLKQRQLLDLEQMLMLEHQRPIQEQMETVGCATGRAPLTSRPHLVAASAVILPLVVGDAVRSMSCGKPNRGRRSSPEF